ncbi:MAG: hypothetical protein A3F68_04590 [Acidobacteria bacterium RIFCSPLOWO2_12_FULL_54_10]|nr:MAG: hypothetical protein A3F68_04590 [Acidobacteria bacterium RIFCSPLOWO2_12_FULL_54_10]OFW12432.1 MAG: hypothetical protein A3H27_09015 [Acidobacteria bacterium RIFCSPLOWO2_02_FULL_59_13]
MPPWLATLARLNPVTHAIEPMRTLMIRGWLWGSIGADLLVVVLFSFLVATISTTIFVRRVEISTL